MSLHAQQGFFIQPQLDLGVTNMRYRASGFAATFRPTHNKDLGYAAGIGAGYQFRRWNIQTGLGYMRTGYRFPVYLVDEKNFQIVASGNVYKWNQYVLLPVTVGYRMPLTKRFALEPLAGGELSYNLGEWSKTTLPGLGEVRKTPSAYFNESFPRLSVFGKAALTLRYSITPRIGIHAGATGRYMLTNFVKQEAVAAGSAVYMHPWLLSGSAGVSYQFVRKPAPRPATTTEVSEN